MDLNINADALMRFIESSDINNPYEVINISFKANLPEIQKKIRRILHRLHPDIIKKDIDLQRAKICFNKVLECKEMFNDESWKAKFDQEIGAIVKRYKIDPCDNKTITRYIINGNHVNVRTGPQDIRQGWNKKINSCEETKKDTYRIINKIKKTSNEHWKKERSMRKKNWKFFSKNL